MGVIRRFPLTWFLSLYHPHPSPPPLGAGVIGADRVVSELEARAPRGNIPLVKALRIVQGDERAGGSRFQGRPSFAHSVYRSRSGPG